MESSAGAAAEKDGIRATATKPVTTPLASKRPRNVDIKVGAANDDMRSVLHVTRNLLAFARSQASGTDHERFWGSLPRAERGNQSLAWPVQCVDRSGDIRVRCSNETEAIAGEPSKRSYSSSVVCMTRRQWGLRASGFEMLEPYDEIPLSIPFRKSCGAPMLEAGADVRSTIASLMAGGDRERHNLIT
jgi:hypothetical protein